MAAAGEVGIDLRGFCGDGVQAGAFVEGLFEFVDGAGGGVSGGHGCGGGVLAQHEAGVVAAGHNQCGRHTDRGVDLLGGGALIHDVSQGGKDGRRLSTGQSRWWPALISGFFVTRHRVPGSVRTPRVYSQLVAR